MAGIPHIAPYAMPTADELPRNTARWTLEPGRAVVLFHDMQRYFLRPFDPAADPARSLLANASSLRSTCLALGIPMAFTAQPGGMTRKERGLLHDFWGPGMRSDAEDREIVESLAPRPHDWLLTKWRYSAFFGTGLLDRMRAHGRDQLVIGGVYGHVGVLMTAVEAFTNDIEPFLVADAVADFSADYHRLTIEYAAGRCAVVSETQALIAQLDDERRTERTGPSEVGA
ncbi:isochorismatase family protein [Halostreptopolyspora alba]|uniref:Isochorismatase family protein n=1 Tax=Halostreptopolyspora alba TaxID=2487137 RepID=A0A3N0EFJ5_9ACTN|nr:isochorismatase family protein [Nocardiopsaceae bacterium YIM 96095]